MIFQATSNTPKMIVKIRLSKLMMTARSARNSDNVMRHPPFRHKTSGGENFQKSPPGVQFLAKQISEQGVSRLRFLTQRSYRHFWRQHQYSIRIDKEQLKIVPFSSFFARKIAGTYSLTTQPKGVTLWVTKQRCVMQKKEVFP